MMKRRSYLRELALQELRGSKKLKPGALSLYVGDGHRAAVKAIGTYHLELPSGLVIVLNNLVPHYAPQLLRDSSLLWHCRLGHISKKRIEKLQHDGLLNSIDIESLGKCVSCLSGKMARKPYSHQVERAKDLLGLIHTDVCGPFRIVSRQGASYFVTFTDDFSRYGYVYLLKHKHEVFETFKNAEFFKNDLIDLKASRSVQWNKRFDDEIKKFGFTQNPDEPCVYLKASGSYVAILILYVDDILLMGNNIPMLQDVKSYLGRSFAMKDLGEAAYILGIKIYRDRSKRLIGLNQSAYIEKILKRFYMENSKRGTIPMQEKLKLSKSQGASTPAEKQRMQNIPYASAVGSIMYVVRCTRPDVAFAQNMTSRFQQNPGEEHWTAVKNILKYLRNTKDMFLVYGGNMERELRVSCYTDAGYLTDADNLKSQTRYVFILNIGTVDWKSTKQSIFATSSTDAEYIAAFDASKEAVWIRKFIYGLGIVPSIEEPISMYCDNTGAIAIAKDDGVTKGARHFRAKVHYLRETIKMGDVKIEKIDTDDNLADPFTKALAFPKHSELTRNIGLLPASSFMNGYLRKGRKTKPKRQNRTRNGKAWKRHTTITVPGGSNQDKGILVFTKEVDFIIFAVSDTILLFSATTALLVFLSILTARFSEKDFLVSLPRRLLIGICTLLLSAISMIVAFSATVFLVFCHQKPWMIAPICGLSLIPISFLVALQLPLIVDLSRSTYLRKFGPRRRGTDDKYLHKFIDSLNKMFSLKDLG
ncbi:retrotransposon protein, putative, ty1-copia subclass, partial [Tanacetum coccineum]